MPGSIARWNRVSGQVWVEPASGGDAVVVATGVTDELTAYDVLARAGFSRAGNWLITPGVAHQRSLGVTPSAT